MPPDQGPVGAAPETAGFLLHLRQLGGSVLDHIAMRVELLSIEAQDEKARLVRLAMSAAMVCASMMISLIMAVILALACYWETPYRVPVALSLTIAFALLTIAGSLYLGAQLRRKSLLFACTAAELRRDAVAMMPVSTAPRT